MANRPIAFAQVMSGALVVGVALFLLRSSGLGSPVGEVQTLWSLLADRVWFFPVLFFALGLFFVLTSIAVYLAILDE